MGSEGAFVTIIAILNWLDFIVVLSLDIRGNNKSTQTWNIWSVSSSKAKPANITLARVPVFTRAQQNQTQKYTYDSAVRIRLALEIILSLVVKHDVVTVRGGCLAADLYGKFWREVVFEEVCTSRLKHQVKGPARLLFLLERFCAFRERRLRGMFHSSVKF